MTTQNNPQDVPRKDAIGTCISKIRDVRFRYDLTDDQRATILLDVYKELGTVYNTL